MCLAGFTPFLSPLLFSPIFSFHSVQRHGFLFTIFNNGNPVTYLIFDFKSEMKWTQSVCSPGECDWWYMFSVAVGKMLMRVWGVSSSKSAFSLDDSCTWTMCFEVLGLGKPSKRFILITFCPFISKEHRQREHGEKVSTTHWTWQNKCFLMGFNWT